MLVSQKWEKQRLEPPSRNIVNVPLPTQQAAKLLKDLQASCNSPNKAIQIEALQCWGTWIQNHNLEEWGVDSVCHFAVKPLLTKKLHPLHKDADVCKLKLSLMWELLINVQGKLELEGPQHILECFLQSCFLWLASIDTIDTKVSVLIVKLLFSLLTRDEIEHECDGYNFPSVTVGVVSLKKVFHIFVDKFLDLFDNWRKVQDKNLILGLWQCFLEHCEHSHDTIITPMWHRIFKVNQAFCSEKSESIKDKLEFLHACATRVKTVLLSSKYIGGETCFMTPVEALLKKLIDICKTDSKDSGDPDIFFLCNDICKVLAFKSIEVCQYDLCINLLDALDDFTLKSCAWGSWCGLVDCYKANLMAVDRDRLTRREMKFYRKLRAITVNYELDKIYLTEKCIIQVLGNIEILNIGCFCGLNKNPIDNYKNSTVTDLSCDISIELSNAKNIKGGDGCHPSQALVPVSSASDRLTGDFGQIIIKRRCHQRLDIFYLDFDLVKNMFRDLDTFTFRCLRSNLLYHNQVLNVKSLGGKKGPGVAAKSLKSLDAPKAVTMSPEDDKVRVRGRNGLPDSPTTAGRNGKKMARKSRRSLVFEPDNPEESCETPRTRSRRRAEEEEENKRKREEMTAKKKRKSFEVLVQEIVNKNKMRKTERNTTPVKNPESPGLRELRSRRKRDPEDEETPVSKAPDTPKQSRTPKDEDKSGRNTTDGKLENFFKVISPASKDGIADRVNSKEQKTTKKKKTPVKKKSQGQVNWKQTSLKSMMSDRVEEDKGRQATIEEKVKPEVTTGSETTTKSTPFVHDHEYAKVAEPCPVLVQRNNFAKCFKKSAKKPDRGKIGRGDEGKTVKADISDVEPQEERSDAVSDLCLDVEKVPKVVVEPAVVDHFHEIRLPRQDDDDDNNEEPDVAMEEQEQVTAEASRTSPEPPSLEAPVEETPKEQIPEDVKPSPENSELNEVAEETVTRDTEVVPSSDSGDDDSDMSKKRDRPVSPVVCQSKKIKLDENSIRETEKENVIVSPDHSNGDVVSPEKVGSSNADCTTPQKTAGDVSPGDHVKSARLTNRTVSSRALKMIALVPESNYAGQQVSPKVETKPQNKKYLGGVDKSSRVSKMLASLNKSLPRVPVTPAEDDSPLSDLPSSGLPTTPNTGNSLTSIISSPKTTKKRKFIGFDDSRNETIIYQVDTPPSEIFIHRERLRDGCCTP